MAAEKAEERSPSKRSQTGGRAQNSNLRSGSRPERLEHHPRDVTGINPEAMRPIDPKSPYIPPP
ncbi:MAG: hypothetical protein ACREQ7_00205 [Candidatus Binatia bacterium]